MTFRLRFSSPPSVNPPLTTVRLAVFSWAISRALDADFVLRLENGGQASASFLEALTWLDIDWDEGPQVGGPYEPYILAQRPLPKQFLTNPPQPGLENGLVDPLVLSAIADHEMEITHVVGSSKETAAVERQHHIDLGWKPPEWIIVPPLVNEEGQPLPDSDYQLEDFQDQGYLPHALFNFLILQGWTPLAGDEILDKWQIRQSFDPAQMADQPIPFDHAKLKRINTFYIRKMSAAQLAEAIQPFLEDVYGPLPMAKGWLQKVTAVIQPQLRTLDDAVEGAEWAFSDSYELPNDTQIALKITENRQVLARLIAEIAAVVLLDEQTAQSIVKGLPPAAQGIILASLTGQQEGMSLPLIMSILGKQTTLQRIANQLR